MKHRADVSLLYSFLFMEEIAILTATGLYLYFNLVENAFSQACFYDKRPFYPTLSNKTKERTQGSDIPQQKRSEKGISNSFAVGVYLSTVPLAH